MSYASDPEWAWKSGYSPERLQAYENQVMIDRAARERHRAQFDTAAVVGGAVLIGSWFQTREARKAEKASKRARAEYHKGHYPRDYGRRRMEYGQALDRLDWESSNEQRTLHLDIERQEAEVRCAVSAKSLRAATSRLDALRSMLDAKRLAYTTALEALNMQYHDVLEYDRVMESL